MHGIGNDYICINLMENDISNLSECAKILSNRHFGVGSDGIILIDKSSVADFKMRMFNPDGSEAQMCGNGIRCLGKYVYEKGLTNKEDITVETKAVKWNESYVESELSLSIAKTTTDWYDYSSGAKRWGNVKTTNSRNTAYWVWIPRYAYKIQYYTDANKTIPSNVKTNYGKIDIKFLAGTSNDPADGTSVKGYIIHPAFTFGGVELTGIWVAKYEASSNTPNVVQADGTYAGANLGGGNNPNLKVNVLPNVYSWRNMSTGNMQKVSMEMTDSSGSVGTSENVDTHQMKNIEWGAVAYLTASQYGEEPWNNPYGDTTANSWKLKTGYAGIDGKNSGALAENHADLRAYNTAVGVNASTTHNIYGIYDMAGGTLEYVAGYINNGNSYLGSQGTSTYFANNILKAEYTKYYDIYEPGASEKPGGIYYGVNALTLWNTAWSEESSVANNTIRKNLTEATYNNMANKKGDGIYETSTEFSYYGKYGSHTYTWIRTASYVMGNAIGWNGDYMLLGHASLPWMRRGGRFDSGDSAGVFAFRSVSGDATPYYSFRPVLVVGSLL